MKRVLVIGGNGSGKSSILNVIAEKLSLERNTPFNRSDFAPFEEIPPMPKQFEKMKELSELKE